MLVDSSGTTFAFPLVMVASILRLDTKDVQYIRGKPVTMLRDTVLPLISLNEVFGFDEGSKKNADWNYVVVVYYGKFKAGIVLAAAGESAKFLFRVCLVLRALYR